MAANIIRFLSKHVKLRRNVSIKSDMLLFSQAIVENETLKRINRFNLGYLGDFNVFFSILRCVGVLAEGQSTPDLEG